MQGDRIKLERHRERGILRNKESVRKTWNTQWDGKRKRRERRGKGQGRER